MSNLCEINYSLPRNTYPEDSLIEVYWGDSPYVYTFKKNQTGWAIVPDYSLAIEDINNGIQPTKFEVTAQ